MCAYNVADVDNFTFPRDAFGPEPLRVLVPSGKMRRDSDTQKCMVVGTPLASGCLVPIGHDVYVASPAFCFIQMAPAMSLFELVELGYELCGLYSRSPGSGRGFFQRADLLTTPKEIQSLVRRMPGTKGIESARVAAPYIAARSASPAETDIATRLVLPYMRGGYGLKVPEMNAPVDLPAEIAVACKSSTLYPDLLWRSARTCVEYDSTSHHEREEDRTRDSIKRNVLARMGFRVVTVTPAQLQDAIAFDSIASEVARHLGKRLREPSVHGQRMRFELNEAVRSRIRDDLRPKEWPYVPDDNPDVQE